MASEHDKYAGQVFVWAGSGNPKDVGEVVAKMRDRITALEEAVKVLADVIVENRKQREYERINKLCPGGCVSARLEQAAVHVLNNPIAAEAVRKAGG